MMIRERNTIYILLLVVFGIATSCQPPRENYIRSVLSDVCFWDVLEKDFDAKAVTTTYRLLPDGRCYKYHYGYSNQEKQKWVKPVDATKGEIDIKWSLQSDSVLTLGEEAYRILKVEKEAVWLKSASLEDVLLSKNCTTYIVD